MRVALIGPEIEENLGLRYLAASLAARGHRAEVIAFDDASQIADVAERGAAGSGWWHVGTSLATATLALAACASTDTNPPVTRPPPAKICDTKAPPRQLVLRDAEHTRAIDDAIAHARATHAGDTFTVTGNDVTGTLQFTAQNSPGNDCYTGGFVGYDVTASIAGAAAGDYELVGIVGVQPGAIAHGEHGEWIRFGTAGPGRDHPHLGVVWRNKTQVETTLVVAAEVPPEPTPPPQPNPNPLHMGCDLAPMPIQMGAPMNADRAVHIGLELGAGYGGARPAGTLAFVAWLDDKTDGYIDTDPVLTTDFGTATTRAYSGSVDRRRVYAFSYDARCADGAVLARGAKIQVELHVTTGQTYKATLEVDITAAGDVKPVGPKSS